MVFCNLRNADTLLQIHWNTELHQQFDPDF
jgi:hypothetical protein